MKTQVSVSKLNLFDQPRVDVNCKSNKDRKIVGAVVFANPVGSNTPTSAVNLTAKEMDMLCRDLDIKGKDAFGNEITSGSVAWSQLKTLVNRHRGCKADLEIEERFKDDTYETKNAQGEIVTGTYEKDSTSIRVSGIDLNPQAIDRLYKIESNWNNVKSNMPDLRGIFDSVPQTANAPV